MSEHKGNCSFVADDLTDENDGSCDCRPSVYFSCGSCGWRHDVPDDKVVLVGGLPRSTYVPFHVCEAPDVSERGAFDAELVTQKPGHWMKITL